MTLETIMNGTKGFRTREAAANHRNRARRLVSEDVRAARFAILHGNVEKTKAPVVEAKPVSPPAEVTETPVDEAADQTETEIVEGAGDQSEGDETDEVSEGEEDEGEEGTADEAGADESKTVAKKKAPKAKVTKKK